MRRIWATMLLAAALLAGATAALGQTPDPGITANGVIGEVVTTDAAARQVFVKTDAGSVVIVTVADSSQFKKLPPGETTLTKASDMTFAQLAAGDRVFARGAVSADRKTVAARILIVNTKADLEAKRAAERAEWQARGIVGVVSALDPATKEITIQTRTPEGMKPVRITAPGAGPAVKFRRYAPDSVKFADAKPSTYEELKVGDQLRAKGEKSADGATFAAEEVVSGSFRTALGTITAVDAAKNEITIKQTPGDQPLTVVVRPDSLLKQFQIPPEVAAMMAGGGGPGAARPGGGQGGGQGQPAGGGGQGPGGPGGGRRGPDIQRMIENLPPVALADLKAGQMIVVSSTVGADPQRVTAIQLVAGVEPLVAMMSRRQGAGPGGSVGQITAAGQFGFGIGQP
jgi:hypothetical protein